MLAEKTITRQGSDWLRSHTVNYYSATGTGGAQPVVTSAGQTGSATGNLLFHYGDTCSDP